MKTIVSVSIGSSKRDHSVETELLGETFSISRRGTDGSIEKAQELLRQLDGHVDAIGLGGLDVYLYSAGQRYPLGDGLKLLRVLKKTPAVDGSGLKNTLERETISRLAREGFDFKGRKVLMVSALDRFGMAESLVEQGANCIYGDLIFALGVDKPIVSLEELAHYARVLLPEVSSLPMSFLYPTGQKQTQSAPTPLTAPYYDEAEIVAGDFLYIKKYLPRSMRGKTVITNTVTAADVELMRQRGLKCLITTTPVFNGRSFGTNVMEALLISILGKRWDEVKPQDYLDLIRRLDFRPRIEHLN